MSAAHRGATRPGTARRQGPTLLQPELSCGLLRGLAHRRRSGRGLLLLLVLRMRGVAPQVTCWPAPLPAPGRGSRVAPARTLTEKSLIMAAAAAGRVAAPGDCETGPGSGLALRRGAVQGARAAASEAADVGASGCWWPGGLMDAKRAQMRAASVVGASRSGVRWSGKQLVARRRAKTRDFCQGRLGLPARPQASTAGPGRPSPLHSTAHSARWTTARTAPAPVV